MTRFEDSHVRPPKSGWRFPINGELVSGSSESEIHDIVKRWRKNNGTYTDDQAISAELWDYYCQREPSRCGRVGAEFTPTFNVPGVTPRSRLIPAEKSPELQGPPIWLFLNTLAAQWNPGLHNYFLATVDAIIVILECPTCREEWRRLLKDFPPAGLNTRFQVCNWVNNVHNAINARRGKQAFTYDQMVVQFGAPVA